MQVVWDVRLNGSWLQLKMQIYLPRKKTSSFLSYKFWLPLNPCDDGTYSFCWSGLLRDTYFGHGPGKQTACSLTGSASGLFWKLGSLSPFPRKLSYTVCMTEKTSIHLASLLGFCPGNPTFVTGILEGVSLFPVKVFYLCLLELCFSDFLAGWLVFSLAQTAMQIAPPVPEFPETFTASFLKFLISSPCYLMIPFMCFSLPVLKTWHSALP